MEKTAMQDALLKITNAFEIDSFGRKVVRLSYVQDVLTELLPKERQQIIDAWWEMVEVCCQPKMQHSTSPKPSANNPLTRTL